MQIKDESRNIVENGNAEVIREVTTSALPFPMLKYEALAEYYTQQPVSISIRTTESDDWVNLEQIFRIRFWVPNEGITSWSIYCEEREVENSFQSGIILRHVIWKRDKDFVRVMNYRDAGIEYEQELTPHIQIENTYLNDGAAEPIRTYLAEIDTLVSNGIVVHNQSSDHIKPLWLDLEVMRIFDWGQVHSTWSRPMGNRPIEDKVTELNYKFEQLELHRDGKIFEMLLDYAYPTEIYRNLIYFGH